MYISIGITNWLKNIGCFGRLLLIHACQVVLPRGSDVARMTHGRRTRGICLQLHQLVVVELDAHAVWRAEAVLLSVRLLVQHVAVAVVAQRRPRPLRALYQQLFRLFPVS